MASFLFVFPTCFHTKCHNLIFDHFILIIIIIIIIIITEKDKKNDDNDEKASKMK